MNQMSKRILLSHFCFNVNLHWQVRICFPASHAAGAYTSALPVVAQTESAVTVHACMHSMKNKKMLNTATLSVSGRRIDQTSSSPNKLGDSTHPRDSCTLFLNVNQFQQRVVVFSKSPSVSYNAPFLTAKLPSMQSSSVQSLY